MYARVDKRSRIVQRAAGMTGTAGQRSAHGAMLDLQRAAGNGAVAGLIRDEGDEHAARLLPIQRRITSTTEGFGPPQQPTGLGPPPRLPEPEEASFQAKGEASLAALGGGAGSGPAGTGHTSVGPIDGFPDWFANLQSALIASQEWRPDKEEAAQQLLGSYGLKRFAAAHGGDTSKVPGTVRIFLDHIGRSTSNVKAAEAAKLPSSKALGGSEGAKNWCAQAGSSSVQLALKAVGLTVDDKQTDWNKWLTSPPVSKAYMQDASVDARIEPGDQVSYLEKGILAVGGHTVTALSASKGEGSVFEHASGNAGGGSSGSVRLGSSPPRAKLPQSITFPDIQAKTADKLGAPAGQIWVYVVVRYSEFWADLGAIDTSAAGVWQSASGREFLKKYRLRPAPVST